MSDFARFLPLSGRPRGGEDAVSTDRRRALAEVVERAASLAAADPAANEGLLRSFVDDAGLGPELDRLETATTPAALRRLAAAVQTGRRRRPSALADAARALLMLARRLDRDPGLDPATAGAVSLWLAASAPFDRRAVVRGRTVRATDAGWSFGRGPVVEGTATGIAAFLLGVSDDAPRPVSPRG